MNFKVFTKIWEGPGDEANISLAVQSFIAKLLRY